MEVKANANPARMKKPVRILYMILFVALMAAPIPIFFCLQSRVDTANYEERTLAPLPFTQEAADYYGKATTFDTFPSQFEDWFNDHLPFRNQLLTLRGLFDYKVLKASSSESVIVGKDGWLFYKGSQVAGEDPVGDYRGTDLFTEEELKKIADNFTAAEQKLAAQGREFYIYIAPNKERVYSEYMPDMYGEPAENCRMNQLVDYLRENTDLKVICSYDALMSYKKDHPDKHLYLKYDTHWNYLGAYVAAQPMMEALDYMYVSPDDIQLTERENGNYDLARLIHLGNILNDDTYYMVSGYTEHPLESSNEDGRIFHYKTTDHKAPGSRLFVIGDSFSAMLTPYIACHYWNGTTMFYYEYTYDEMQQEDPTVVIYETVERYIGNMLDFTLEDGYTGNLRE